MTPRPTPSSSPNPTPPGGRNSLSDLILDSMFGDLPSTDATRLSEALAADATLEAERTRLGVLLERERTAQTDALASVLDPKAAERMAARIVDRVRRDEDRGTQRAGGRRFWARFLAISVAAHVVALGVFSYRHFSVRDSAATTRPDLDGRDIAYAPLPSDASPSADRPFVADPLAEALPGYRIDVEELLPVERFLEKATTDAAGDADPALSSRPLGTMRAMWVRTSDPMKRLVEARVGVAGTLDRVKSSLAALARVQADDGSFADAAGRPSTRATATVLLAFLGDGHSSRGGAHRTVVERGVAWLAERAGEEAATSGERSLALLALSEDVLLANGDLTPAEARFRIAGLSPLAHAVQAAAASAPYDRSASADARWTELALAAAARVGAIRATTVATTTIDPSTVRPADDVRTAMLDGTTLLKDRRGTAFRAWNTDTARRLGARLGGDGLIAGTTSSPARAEETALVLLALEVAYRTY